ncbi:unnamed protein product [Adineta steineri]|uniref:Selenoprotein S n=1 Tax=Adineta steineri TaxID=433720 RepID=A0A813UXW3_9BILA|nr:unnamed protein product [Adineta steineri]CAF0829578.1 unnamed protein product [Adineta steineri]CAF3654917.1 unnamed protein product [Adineta steineri]CAF3933063.1 unnamed protein product [Adineta steineri]
MDDDVTIEDEIDSNDRILSESENKLDSTKWSFLYQIFIQQWTILLFILILTIIWVYFKRNRRENTNLSDDSFNRYEHMERIRQRQQKEYEEQAIRRAEEKKAKIEALKSTTDEKSSRLKYRSNDHNPLTGQSTRSEGGSCSWRPSSKRGPGGAGG